MSDPDRAYGKPALDGPADAMVRTLRPGDVPAIVAFVLSLPPAARRPLSHGITAAAVQKHFETLDWDTTAVFGWFEGGALCAVAEACGFDPLTGRDADLAIIQRPQWRGDPALDLLLICVRPELARHVCQPGPAPFRLVEQHRPVAPDAGAVSVH